MHDAVVAPQTVSLEAPVERVIKPAKRRLKARDLIGDAPIVRVLAGRDFKVKYKQSVLGPLWLVFQPLALLAAFVVAFQGLGDVETSGFPYAVFALVGLTVWSFFQAAMTIGTASVVTNANYVRFTPCPRPAFPMAAIIASLPAFGVTATWRPRGRGDQRRSLPEGAAAAAGSAVARRAHPRHRCGFLGADRALPGGHLERAPLPASGRPVPRTGRLSPRRSLRQPPARSSTSIP